MNSSTERLVVIAPRRFRFLDFRELWRFRELVLVLALRDVRLHYAQTGFGVAWAILQPAASAALFAAIFGRHGALPSDGLPYAMFVIAGILPWTFFLGAVTRAATSAVESANLIGKVYFPRVAVPIAAALAGVVDLLVATPVLVAALAFYEVEPTARLLALPLVVLAIVVTAVGVGTLLCALTVSFRDFRYVIPFMMQLWMYASPVIYSPRMLDEPLRTALYLNPLTGLLDALRACLFGHPFLWPQLALSSSVAALCLIAGVALFSRVERRMADVL